MTGASTIAHHHELHERVSALEAELAKHERGSAGCDTCLKLRAEAAEARVRELEAERPDAEFFDGCPDCKGHKLREARP